MRNPIKGERLTAADGTIYIVAMFVGNIPGRYFVELDPAHSTDEVKDQEFAFDQVRFEEFCKLEGIDLA